MTDRYAISADSFCTFFVDAIPVAQPRSRARAFVNSEGITKVRMYEAKPAHAIHVFKLAVREAALKACNGIERQTTNGVQRMYVDLNPIIDGPIVLEIEIVLPRPQCLMRKKDAPYKSVLHHKMGDIDNYAKAIMDAMDGIFWANDCQVAKLYAAKYYAAGGERPHCRIMVGPARTERTPRNEH